MEHTIQVQKEDMIFNVLSIGEVKSGETASATITGKEPNQILNLTLPKGDTGNTGPQGGPGPKGNDGYTPVRGTDYWTTSDKQEIVTNVLNEVDIPTKTSDLTNDSGFVTNAVSDLVNYYLKDNTYSKTEVNTLVNNITKVTISIVDTLPTTGESNIIYFVPKTGSTNDVYDEYVWISNAWEHIGSTDVDLTGYANESWVNAQIANFLTEAQVNTLITNALANYALKSEIPTKNSQLQNDSGFITGYTETDPTVPTHVKTISTTDIMNWNNKANTSDIPNVSDFITKNVNDLVNYYNKDNSYNKTEIDGFLENMSSGETIKGISGVNYIYNLEPGIYRVTSTANLYYKPSKQIICYKNSILIVAGSDSYLRIFMVFATNTNSNGSNLIYFGVSNKTNGYFYDLSMGSYDIVSSSSKAGYIGSILTTETALSKTNTIEFNPTGNYNPATKKYVDDTIKSKINATFTLDGTTLNINTEA